MSLPIFTEEHEMIREVCRDFAKDKLEPVAEKMDQEDYFPLDLFKELGELGLLAPTIPSELGGADADYIAQAIILEELAKVSPAFALSIGAHSNLTLDNIFRNANEEQRERFVPKLASGEWMGALCITEPGAGSDALSLSTVAREEGDHYLITGSKTYITNAYYSKLALVYAKTAPELKGKGITAFVMDLETEGVTRGEPFDKMGMRGSKTSELFFDDVKVPKGNILGEVNGGLNILMSGLSLERATLAAISVGISKTALDIAVKYSREREQFGKPIGTFQMIQDKMARMYTEMTAADLMVYSALYKPTKDKSFNKKAAASIYYAADLATKHALEAIQILGGYGYMKEYKIEKFMRDAKLMEIGAGTQEIRKLIIAKDLFQNY